MPLGGVKRVGNGKDVRRADRDGVPSTQSDSTLLYASLLQMQRRSPCSRIAAMAESNAKSHSRSPLPSWTCTSSHDTINYAHVKINNCQTDRESYTATVLYSRHQV
jgi:hypothetical protein